MTASLEVNRTQLGAASAAFDRLSKVLADLSPTMEAVGAYLVSSTQRRFETGIAPDGVAWKPSIRVLMYGGQTLKDYGHLKGSIAAIPHRDSVEVGSNKIYAGTHQFGATIHAKKGPNLKFQIGGHWISKPSVTIAARPFLGIDQRDQVEIEAIVLADLASVEAGKPLS